MSLRMSAGLHVSRGVEVCSAKVCVRWPPCKLREELLGWERRCLTVMHAAVSRSWKVGIALSTAGGRRLGHGRSRHSCHLEDEHHEIVKLKKTERLRRLLLAAAEISGTLRTGSRGHLRAHSTDHGTLPHKNSSFCPVSTSFKGKDQFLVSGVHYFQEGSFFVVATCTVSSLQTFTFFFFSFFFPFFSSVCWV